MEKSSLILVNKRYSSTAQPSLSRFIIRIVLSCTLLAISSCVSIPRELTVGAPFADITPLQAQADDQQGERVRWGGTIIHTAPQRDQTCFEVMGLSLDNDAEPQSNDRSLGRFIACAKGFYEPALYATGRSVTFTGRIDGTEQQKVGEFLYSFPRLTVDAVYLWPKRPNVIYVPYYDSFWDPIWPYYPPYPRR